MPAAFCVLAIAQFAVGDPTIGLAELGFAVVAVLYARIAVDSYLRGYWRGVGAAVNALEQSETPDEFARLVTSTPPPPWQ